MLDFFLDIRECFERDIRNLVVIAVFLELQALPRKQDIRFPGSREIRDTVADEDDKWDFSLDASSRGFSATLINREGLVMS